ncbi:putative Glyoxylate reductase [Glarea lozoyensis 74030]|uniref:Putative Glyoxylate reductase n=1 Tax=Glarea lozoyensis (strain ATCC 74030 / MF5533) TaxID=1104152 RepID=H0EUE1_GLAL7|nr:putative Glyoxylate reductase [Glarea lozoyensis 74030]
MSRNDTLCPAKHFCVRGLRFHCQEVRQLRELLQQLPGLKLLLTTATRNLGIDMVAAKELGITVTGTTNKRPPNAQAITPTKRKGPDSTTQHTVALILGIAKNLARDNDAVKRGEWQLGLSTGLTGKTLGLLGLGRLGIAVGKIMYSAFGMKIIAWSSNLTQETADEKATNAGLPIEDEDGDKTFRLVSKEELFKNADVLSVHYVLSDRSRGIVGAEDLKLMKRSALFINTSRGPLVDEDALLQCLSNGAIKGAALDVFALEPLPLDSKWRTTNWGQDGTSQPKVTACVGSYICDTNNYKIKDFERYHDYAKPEDVKLDIWMEKPLKHEKRTTLADVLENYLKSGTLLTPLITKGSKVGSDGQYMLKELDISKEKGLNILPKKLVGLKGLVMRRKQTLLELDAQGAGIPMKWERKRIKAEQKNSPEYKTHAEKRNEAFAKIRATDPAIEPVIRRLSEKHTPASVLLSMADNYQAQQQTLSRLGQEDPELFKVVRKAVKPQDSPIVVRKKISEAQAKLREPGFREQFLYKEERSKVLREKWGKKKADVISKAALVKRVQSSPNSEGDFDGWSDSPRRENGEVRVRFVGKGD